MASIYDASAACFRLFGMLRKALTEPGIKPELLDHMPPSLVEENHGRYKVWLGNLGALQQGHGSLDFRLRESSVMQAHVIKLLDQLRSNLDESAAVVSGSRLPFELQTQTSDSDDDDEASETSSEDSEDEPAVPRSELRQRLSSINNIIADLYKLSFKIRSTTTRAKTRKTATYTEVDPDTGVELYSQYAVFDSLYVSELLHSLQKSSSSDEVENSFLIDRLGRAITRRRKQFRYWKRHGSKLATAHTPFEQHHDGESQSARQHQSRGLDTGGLTVREKLIRLDATPSVLSRSIFSGTEATTYDKKLDDLLETQSVVSYATTVYNFDGKGVDLPPPPPGAGTGSGFVCPYCMVLCPPRHGTGRSWRAHIIQDLQPYMCTYPDCAESNTMFSSRRQWLEHEGSAHRKAWQCFEHSGAVFGSADGFRNHLKSHHPQDMTDEQVADVAEVAETYLIDERKKCPFCLVQLPSDESMQTHLAYHLEAIACFSLPRSGARDEDSQASSNAPQARSHGSQNSWSKGSLTFPEPPPQSSSVSENPDARSSTDSLFGGSSNDSLFGVPLRPPGSYGNASAGEPSQKVPEVPSDVGLENKLDFSAGRMKEAGSITNASETSASRQDGSGSDTTHLTTNKKGKTLTWRKGQMISKGPHCRAYLGINMTSGEFLVVKEYAVRSKEYQKRLAMEIDTFYLYLDHPNLVQILGQEESKSSFTVFEEYVPGSSIGVLLRKYGKFEDSVTRNVTRQTTEALEYLHREGVLHRSLKADEIQLDTRDGTCKLCLNFDTSRMSDLPDEESSDMTGAVFWMAPEVVRSSGKGYSDKTDIWSLGCIVLEMMAGRRPWSKEEAVAAIYKLGSLSEAPPIPDDVMAAASMDGIAFLYDCFTVDPSERPTAKSLLRGPYLKVDFTYHFPDTELCAKIKKSEEEVAEKAAADGTKEVAGSILDSAKATDTSSTQAATKEGSFERTDRRTTDAVRQNLNELFSDTDLDKPLDFPADAKERTGKRNVSPEDTIPYDYVSQNAREAIEKYAERVRNSTREDCPGTARRGQYMSTVLCGYTTKNAFDWKKHEETHWPQEFWVCEICRTASPQKMFVVGSRDKMLQHIKDTHPDADADEVVEQSKQDYAATFSRRCGLCGNYFGSWDSRNDHLLAHFDGKLEGGIKTMAAWRDPAEYDHDKVKPIDDSDGDEEGNDNASTHATQSGSSYNDLVKLLDEMKTESFARLFLVPVIGDAVPRGFDLTKQPLDLVTMEQKLKSGGYLATSDFVDDVARMLQKYHRNDESALALQRHIVRKIEEMPKWVVLPATASVARAEQTSSKEKPQRSLETSSVFNEARRDDQLEGNLRMDNPGADLFNPSQKNGQQGNVQSQQSVAAPAPQVQQPPMDNPRAPFGSLGEEFNSLDFPPVDGPDVSENFDFDSFLHAEDTGAFGPLGGDYNIEVDGVEAGGDPYAQEAIENEARRDDQLDGNFRNEPDADDPKDRTREETARYTDGKLTQGRDERAREQRAKDRDEERGRIIAEYNQKIEQRDEEEKKERQRLIDAYQKEKAEEEAEAKEARDRAVAEYERKKSDDAAKAKEARDRAIAEYERKKSDDAAKAKQQKEELIFQLEMEKKKQEDKEKADWEAFLQEQKAKEEEEKAKKKKKQEEELENQMRQRLAELELQENDTQQASEQEEQGLPSRDTETDHLEPAPKPDPRATLYGEVLYDFKAAGPDEMDVTNGEAVIIVAQSNKEWVVAKPITRLGGPGLIPLSYLEMRDMETLQIIPNAHEAIENAGVPNVAEWKRMGAEYRKGSLPVGSLKKTVDDNITGDEVRPNMNRSPQQLAQQPQTAARDLMFCHECKNEWYSDEHGLSCPKCHSDFTEIVEDNIDSRHEDEAFCPYCHSKIVKENTDSRVEDGAFCPYCHSKIVEENTDPRDAATRAYSSSPRPVNKR
ncbi:hypothetical protein BU16DRAFT_537163 [Lophium mytilinum]|uniref:mitogen-activated protein kinase n=1 Tax=Lophium mytilinum TaxID=390894 RepID=A0A6A6QZT7_9PEZI|nr:hypothetical protein BU16DRAFT_537163 [Lophium mytilinum]